MRIGTGRDRTQIPFIQDVKSGKWKLFREGRSVIYGNPRFFSKNLGTEKPLSRNRVLNPGTTNTKNVCQIDRHARRTLL